MLVKAINCIEKRGYMYGIGFYDEYITRLGNLRDKPDLATPYKIAYLKKLIKNNEVYKFISFQKNAETKLKTLKEGKIWFSFYKTLNDETEFQIDYRIKKIVNETGYKKGYIELIINYLTEMYDVFSLTYTYEEYMWDAYASEGNGICVVYNVGNYDQLYPVEYCEKNTLDFTKMIINALKRKSFELSIIPWVVKNPYNETAKLDSTKEKEVRMLYCPYDLAEFNGGQIQYNIKERKAYKGIAKSYTDFELSISRIIIGRKCTVEMRKEVIDYAESNDIQYSVI